MNYYALYWKIVNTAIKREYPCDDEYENHHIIPRSEGGSNKKSNKVRLTPKEHHICHLCLIKTGKCLKYCFRHLTVKQYLEMKQAEREKLKRAYARKVL